MKSMELVRTERQQRKATRTNAVTRPGDRRAPPPQRAKALAFIQAESTKPRGFPTVKQIAAHMGWRNEQSARDCLSGLLRDGWVERDQAGRWLLRPAPGGPHS